MKSLAGVVDEETRDKTAQAARLVQLAVASGASFFHDERGTPYVRMQASAPHILPVRSNEYKVRLAGLLWRAEEKVPGGETLSSALNILEYQALEGPRVTLHTRVCWHEGSVWLDMADDEGRAIKVGRDGWTIENNPPILFRRFSHQKPLVTPVHDGDAWKLMDHSNVSEKHQLLVMVHIGTLLLPGFSHPLWNTYGPQGAAKSTLHEFVKAMIDPSIVGLLAPPREERELVQVLDHHYLAFFDNVASLPRWISDALCRAVTGLGFSKRQLWTDDTDFIYQFMRCVSLNGVNVVARSPDLLDRSLLTELPSIPEDKKKPKEELSKRFGEDLPSILGGFLDTIVKALRMDPPMLPRNYRMADFVNWGYRIAVALGKDGDRFLEDYKENIELVAEETVDADLLGPILRQLVLTSVIGQWSGYTSKLLDDLVEKAEEAKLSTRQKAWPKSPEVLGRRLRYLKEPLGRLMVGVEFGRDKKASTVKLWNILPQPTLPTLPTPGEKEKAQGVGRARDEPPPGVGRARDEPPPDPVVDVGSNSNPESFPGSLVSQCLGRLRKREGPYSEAYLLEQFEGVAGDLQRARLCFQHAVKDGQLFQGPDGYWRLVK